MQSEYNAWNTGIISPVPYELSNKESLLQANSRKNTMKDINELSQILNVPRHTLVLFSTERLVLHETLVRVTANVDISDGENVSDLGKEFRGYCRTLLDNHIMPHIEEFKSIHDKVYEDTKAIVNSMLEETFFPPKLTEIPQEEKKGFLSKIFNTFNKPSEPKIKKTKSQQEHYDNLKALSQKHDNDFLMESVYRNLSEVVGLLMVRDNGIKCDKDLLLKVVTNKVCNEYGSEMVGDAIRPYLQNGIDLEGIPRVKKVDDPIIISLKGASAAGKSSLRLDMNNNIENYVNPDDLKDLEGFSIISPDIMRKMLLDFKSLGEDHKYAGALTSQELAIIDTKIDHYLRKKFHDLKEKSNVLIDRFRFDTFLSDRPSTSKPFIAGSNLKMFFLVTDPEELVERGWNRGIESGRYRSCEDFLGLAVEAYKGMPDKFFQWIGDEDQAFDCMFLNNNVPKGEPLIHAAHGNRHEITISHIETFTDIVKNQKISIRAKSSAELFKNEEDIIPKNNTSFIEKICETIPVINFSDNLSGITYARIDQKGCEVIDNEIFNKNQKNQTNVFVFEKLGFKRQESAESRLNERPSPDI